MKKHFETLLRPLFRHDAEFRYIERQTDDLSFRVLWTTPEPGRPNKHSRPIEIRITSEVLEDYADAARDDDRAEMDQKVVRFVRQRLENFDPHHDLPREQAVPAAEWVITTQIAFY